jgi:hypothetical protein
MRQSWLLMAGLLAACTKEEVQQPSWLVVELTRAPAAQALNVGVQITPQGREPFAVCVNVEGEPGATTASMLLERARDADASAPVGLVVTGYRELNGQLAPGQEFTCPPEFPPAVGEPQDLEVRFCAGATRRVVFNIGANCGCSSGVGGGGGGGAGGAGGGATGAGGGTGPCCPSGQLCGAGISTTGSVCGEGECCKRSIGDACIELDTP